MAQPTKSSALATAANIATFYLNKWGSKIVELAESFSPEESDNWGDEAPETQDAALDQLAARMQPVSVSDATTTAGGAATESVVDTAVQAGDLVVWSILDSGTNTVTGVSATAGAGKVDFEFSGDPSSDTIISYAVFRPAAS